MQRLLPLVLPAFLGACALARTPSPTTFNPVGLTSVESPVADSTASVDQVLAYLSTQRVAELKSRGGECAAYGSVLETSLLDGRVMVRPFMWRVGGRLVSGEATSHGDIVVARHIDPMNVGVRTVADMVRTLEHEAAHVTFKVPNTPDIDLANAIVQACRGGNESPPAGVPRPFTPPRPR
jgi:hypothetical protein